MRERKSAAAQSRWEEALQVCAHQWLTRSVSLLCGCFPSGVHGCQHTSGMSRLLLLAALLQLAISRAACHVYTTTQLRTPTETPAARTLPRRPSDVDLGPPVHEPWVTQSCQYGSIAGSWQLPPPTDVAAMHEAGEPFNQPGITNIPFSADYMTAEFGGRWQAYDPSCQLRNLVKPYLDGQVLRPPTRPLHIMLLSDSTDATAVHLLPEHILRRIGGNNSASYDQIFGGSRIRLNRGHEPRLNYALIPGVGLNLYLMYILGVDPTQTPEDRMAVRVQLARQEFERLAPNGTEPDIVVVHNDHWSLSAFSKESPDAFAPPVNTLTQAYIASYLRNMSDFVHLARQAFPSSLMVTHTSVMVRHNANSGREEGHLGWKGRGWVNRMFVTQLNQATRYLARQLNLPLVDWDLITLGLTPSQTLRDDIHPKDWLMHEFYNIMLNLHEDYTLGTKTMMKRSNN